MRLFALLFLVCALGCGSNGSAVPNTGSDMATPGGGSGGSPGGGGGGSGGASGGGGGGGASGGLADMAGSTGGFVCGSMTCPAGSQCCVTGTTPACATSCAGGFTVDCAKPSDCTSGNACCVTAQAAIVPSFSIKIQNVACAPLDSCVPSADVTTLKVLTRACTRNADCTVDSKGGSNNTQYPDCCTNMGQHVCFKNSAQLPTGWTCP